MYSLALSYPNTAKKLYSIFVTTLSLCALRVMQVVGHPIGSASFALGSDIPAYVYQRGEAGSLAQKLGEEDGVVMVLLYREGCPYCRAFIPDFQKLAKNYRPKGVSFGSIRFSDDPMTKSREKGEIAALYGIPLRTFPCLVIFKNGEKVKVIQGNEQERALPRLEAELDQWLSA